jgi:hypothetical protein
MSSATDLSSGSIKTQLKSSKIIPKIKILKDPSTESHASSISEDLFNEEKILTSLIIKNEAPTENYTSKFVDESFGSSSKTITTSRSKSQNKKINQKKKTERKDSFDDSSLSSSSSSSSTSLFFTEQYSSFKSKDDASFSKNKYSQDFESLSEESSLNTELEDFLNMSHFRKQQLKKQDNITYLINKIKLEQKNFKLIKKHGQYNLKSIPTNKKQVDKLIERIENYSSETSAPVAVNKATKGFKINSDVVNRLDAVNSVVRVKREQEEKIQNFGDDLNNTISENEANRRVQNIYYKMKLNQVNSKITNEHFTNHEVFYCDSLMLIGDLAANLPKLSDSREKIWNQLIAPLENLNHKETIRVIQKNVNTG